MTSYAEQPASTASAYLDGDPERPSLGEYLLGIFTRPTETIVRARGQRYWGTAAALTFVTEMLTQRTSDFSFDVTVLPILIILGLVASYPLMGVVRSVTGGVRGIADATASQTVLIVGVTSLPGALLTLTDAHLLTDVVTFGLSLVGLVYTVVIVARAFGCSVGRAIGGLLVALLAAFVVAFALVALVAVMRAHSGMA